MPHFQFQREKTDMHSISYPSGISKNKVSQRHTAKRRLDIFVRVSLHKRQSSGKASSWKNKWYRQLSNHGGRVWGRIVSRDGGGGGSRHESRRWTLSTEAQSGPSQVRVGHLLIPNGTAFPGWSAFGPFIKSLFLALDPVHLFGRPSVNNKQKYCSNKNPSLNHPHLQHTSVTISIECYEYFGNYFGWMPSQILYQRCIFF